MNEDESLQRAKEVEQRLADAINRAIDDNIITTEEQEELCHLMNQLNEIIMEDNVITPQEREILERVTILFNKVDAIVEGTSIVYKELFDKAIEEGSADIETYNKLKEMLNNTENAIKADGKITEKEHQIMVELTQKFQTLSYVLFFFNH